MNYTQLDEQLQGRNRERRKLANNTYAERRGEGVIAIRLHATDILTYRADGSISVNTGGWRTVTTKARLNEYLPNGYRLIQNRSMWYWVNGSGWANKVHFSDGDTINSLGALVTQAPMNTEEKDRAMLKRIDKYAKLYGKALPLDKPGAGDCFGCQFRDDKGNEVMGTDHLIGHMDEGYVVPSLAYAAMRERGAGPAWYWSVFKTDSVTDPLKGQQNWMMDSARKEIVRWVRRYMRRRLGLAS
jgi:hypothetical protein